MYPKHLLRTALLCKGKFQSHSNNKSTTPPTSRIRDAAIPPSTHQISISQKNVTNPIKFRIHQQSHLNPRAQLLIRHLRTLTVIISILRARRTTDTHRTARVRHAPALSVLLHRRARRRRGHRGSRTTRRHGRRAGDQRRRHSRLNRRASARARPHIRAGNGIRRRGLGGVGVDVKCDTGLGTFVCAGEGDEVGRGGGGGSGARYSPLGTFGVDWVVLVEE